MQPQSLQRKYAQVFQSVGLESSAVSVYAQRRSTLLSNLSSLCLFSGVPRIPGSEETWTYSFQRQIQDPAFLFLTGVNQPGAFLALDPLTKKLDEREILFLPDKIPDREFWDGAMLGLPAKDDSQALAEMQILTGFKCILHAKDFWGWVRGRLPKLRRDHVFAFWHEYTDSETHKKKVRDEDHNALFRDRLRTSMRRLVPNMELRTVAPLHMHHRLCLDKPRIRMAKQAQDWTKIAFESTLRALPTLDTERNVAAHLEWEFRKCSDDGLAFPTIVACGENACTLHYAKCDEPLQKGRLLLLDFGVRYGSLCSDISRTVPVSGVFNPLQRLLYQIVLDTQEFHQSQIKPGKTLRQLNLLAWEYLEELLRERFLAKGGEMRRQYPRLPEDLSKPYSKGPHGISHLIGEQVHEGDPFRTYQDQPLRPGMMISNEPGIYGYFAAEFNGVRYQETIGIRIEDDLLVTAKGCLNLSQDIPKDPDELELILNHK